MYFVTLTGHTATHHGKWDTGWVGFDGHRVRMESSPGLWNANPGSGVAPPIPVPAWPLTAKMMLVRYPIHTGSFTI